MTILVQKGMGCQQHSTQKSLLTAVLGAFLRHAAFKNRLKKASLHLAYPESRLKTAFLYHWPSRHPGGALRPYTEIHS
jgi:hypothetical protein